MEFILTVCTWGILGICSQNIQHEYHSEDSCYRAMNSLYETKGEQSFLYITCSPKKALEEATE